MSFVTVETCQIFYLIIIIAKTQFYGLERSISERKNKKMWYVTVLTYMLVFDLEQIRLACLDGNSDQQNFGARISRWRFSCLAFLFMHCISPETSPGRSLVPL